MWAELRCGDRGWSLSRAGPVLPPGGSHSDTEVSEACSFSRPGPGPALRKGLEMGQVPQNRLCPTSLSQADRRSSVAAVQIRDDRKRSNIDGPCREGDWGQAFPTFGKVQSFLLRSLILESPSHRFLLDLKLDLASFQDFWNLSQRHSISATSRGAPCSRPRPCVGDAEMSVGPIALKTCSQP